MNTRRYGLYGAIIGLFFPIFGSIFQATLDTGGGGFLTRLVRAQSMPLAWLIDLAPLVLGLVAWLGGNLQSRVVSQELSKRQGSVQTVRELCAVVESLVSSVSFFSSLNGSLRETTTSLSQLGQSAAQAALTAETVIGVADASRKSSEAGLRAVDASMAEMKKLAEDIRTLSNSVAQLDDHLREVFETASVVDYIVDRLKRLTGSAVAEIGRIPAGSGLPLPLRFVVAELSRQSADAKAAATRVKERLNDVRKAMLNAMTSAEEGARRAEQGAKVASNTGENIQRLATALVDSSRAARGIAVVAQQQDKSIDRILKAMNEIFLASEEALASTKNVTEQANTLTSLARRFDQSMRA